MSAKDAVDREMRFVKAFNEMMNVVHQMAVDKGWWDECRNDGEAIALIHSELSEGLEALRAGARSDKIAGFDGIEEELADVIIRIMDIAAGRDWRVAEALVWKVDYNSSRERRHGKRF